MTSANLLDESMQNWIAQCAVSASKSHEIAGELAQDVEREKLRPFYLLRPRVYPDGDQWCALYGENLQHGVAGFGKTPADAAIDFDIHFLNEKLLNEKRFACEGCGEMVDEVVEDSGMNVLCKHCASLPD